MFGFDLFKRSKNDIWEGIVTFSCGLNLVGECLIFLVCFAGIEFCLKTFYSSIAFLLLEFLCVAALWPSMADCASSRHDCLIAICFGPRSNRAFRSFNCRWIRCNWRSVLWESLIMETFRPSINVQSDKWCQSVRFNLSPRECVAWRCRFDRRNRRLFWNLSLLLAENLRVDGFESDSEVFVRLLPQFAAHAHVWL